MNWKRGVAWLTILSVFCGSLAGCGGREAEREKVSLNVKVNATLAMTTYADSEIANGYDFLVKAAQDFTERYEAADVVINVVEMDSTEEDQEITEAFDTVSAPDVLLKEYINMTTYIYTGRVVPLDDIITDDIREDIPREYWEISRLDNKTYMIPFLGMQNVLAFNKDLFRKSGLGKYIGRDNEVQSWTLEEWDRVLSALKKRLPGTCYPMMMYAADDQGDTHTMTLLRAMGCPGFDGNGRFCINTQEGIDAIKLMQKYNEKGYFPPNAETMVILDNQALFLNNQLGIYLMNSNLEVFAREKGIDFGLVNFPSLDGVGCNTMFLTGFEVFDNNDEAKLRVAKDFVKYIYESKWLEYSAGSIPVSKKVSEKYAEQLQELAPYMRNRGKTLDITGNNPNWRGVRAVFYKRMQDILYGAKKAEDIAVEIDRDCNKAIDVGYACSTLHK